MKNERTEASERSETDDAANKPNASAASTKKTPKKRRAGTDEGNAAERVERKRRRKKALLLEELRNSLGLVSSACDKVGVGRTTFYEWLKNDPEFARQVDEIEERALDFVESKMFQAIQNGDVRLIQFYLSTKGRKRGYAPKTDVETGPVVLRISQAATARLRARVRAFLFDSLPLGAYRFVAGRLERADATSVRFRRSANALTKVERRRWRPTGATPPSSRGSAGKTAFGGPSLTTRSRRFSKPVIQA